ncbi:MAG: NAD-glutamate dehydrogenase [Egibacteraceae bacterium]
MTTTDDSDGTDEAFWPLLEALKARLGDQGGIVADLAVAAYRRAPDDVTRQLHRDVDASAARLADAFDFLDGRPPGELALRVFNPDEDEHGWSLDATIVQVNVEDGPFLLSTVTEELARLGFEPADVLHPVIGVVRDPDWHVVRIERARGASNRESFIHVQLVEQLDDGQRAEVASNLRRVLADARAATRDFDVMKRRVRTVRDFAAEHAGARYEEDEVAETCALLDWLLDDHFVLLGYRTYLLSSQGEPTVRVDPGSGLGILAAEERSAYVEPVPLADVPEGLRSRIVGGDLLTVSRTNRPSTVHRQQRMIYVGVKRVDDEGRIVGEDRILGLFAQKAYAQPASAIPVLRRKLGQILDREDVVEHSYDERALRALWDAIPKHELFAADTEQLRRTMVRLLETQKRQNVRVLTRVDITGRSVSALVSVPRERFNASIRKRVQSLLVQRFDADGVDYQLSMTERDQALLHFLLYIPAGAADEVQLDGLEQEVVAVTRTWDDGLREALVAAHGETEGAALAERWTGRFPAGYQSLTDPPTAVADIAELEALDDEGPARMLLQRAGAERDCRLRVKLYKVGEGVELSGFLPVLESLGLVVVEEVPHDIVPPAAGDAGADGQLHVHDFGVRLEVDADLDLEVDGPRLAASALATYRGLAEADSLNRLVLRAGVEWDDVVVLRAYRRYRRQVGTSFTEAYQNDALVERADIASALIELFRARFDPDADTSDETAEAARATVLERLDSVERLDQDRILRRYLGMIDATLRTNRYVEGGSAALALKLDSARVPEVVKPVPFVEVFVYSPEVEGVHLRGGPVARGGIRWSDRQEDFRTDVLGLMKAQMLKNAVIVPTGSKGGFVLKRRVGPADLRDEVRHQYETYIKALLDITDNVVVGDVTPPARVVRRDGDDPYLVVAAGKGTAKSSDAANVLSEAYGYWLGDAFASGGSRGYDHKAMGITARGAWVAVQRHFRELDVDVQTEPITVVGIGDMSGDVFGNGLLRSRAVRLVAAFDHRDIFVDPEPDPERSFEERARLYELPGSSWQDYDRSALSQGGGVWSRSVKSIKLSEQMRRVLRTDAERMNPPELVKAILRAPTDLLFAGGIGTFVKASSEAHTDVGDRVNDAIRVDATELGARVVGEGGNLALTQRGRIAYARRGGRCNTDAIDNAAGVDTSDREVNLKILLGMAAEDGRLEDGARDRLLVSMTDDVAGAVLRDIYLQTWTISSEVAGSPGGMEAYEQLMQDLEARGDGGGSSRAGRLDRGVELLPSSTEMRERQQAGAGLTRPELAVLLGYAKVDLRTRLLGSDLPDSPDLRDVLVEGFPPAAVEGYGDLLDRHRLRRDLVATGVANDLVNRMGVTYVSRTAHELGCMAHQVATAYWIARTVVEADARWRRIESLDERCDAGLQLELKGEVDRLVDACVRAYVREGVTAIGPVVERDGPAFVELAGSVTELGSEERRAARSRAVDRYVDLGIPDDLAAEIVVAGDLAITPDVAEIARATGRSARQVADVFFRVSEALPMELLARLLSDTEPEGHWQRWQHRGLLDELREVRRVAAARVISDHPDAAPADAVAAFQHARRHGRERIDAMIALLEREGGSTGLDPIAVATRVLREAVT